MIELASTGNNTPLQEPPMRFTVSEELTFHYRYYDESIATDPYTGANVRVRHGVQSNGGATVCAQLEIMESNVSDTLVLAHIGFAYVSHAHPYVRKEGRKLASDRLTIQNKDDNYACIVLGTAEELGVSFTKDGRPFVKAKLYDLMEKISRERNPKRNEWF